MGSHIYCLMHVVFSTKGRAPMIDASWRNALWAYMGGIARENNVKPLEVGGVADHAHMLLSFPSTETIADNVKAIKAGSSLWIHTEFPHARDFEWQEGYGAFSVSYDRKDSVISYIRNQETHHRQKSFQEEYVEFLEQNGIEFNPKYLW